MKKELYGVTKDGKEVYQYTAVNKNGMEMTVMDFGAILSRVVVADKDGNKRDVVLACENLEIFQENECYLGSIIAPSANRIAKAEAPIDGVVYKLEANTGEHNLHTKYENGMNKRIWDAEELENGICFTFVLEDMEYGLPGKRTISVTYTLTDENEIHIDFKADSDKNTVMNMTNHSYFNLDGHETNTILNHKLRLNASRFTVVAEYSIPTGEIASVKGTPLDFTDWRVIGTDIDADFEPLNIAKGYDQNFVIDDWDGTLKEIAQAKSEDSGIVLTVMSDLPGVQFYAGNFIEKEKGKEGMIYGKRSGFCLETQYFPDAVHHDNFPSVIFGPERPFRSTTIFKFGV